jgi:hypothetical protein
MEVVKVEETKFEKIISVILKENIDFRILFGIQGNFGDKKDTAGKIVFNFKCITSEEYFNAINLKPNELINACSGDQDAYNDIIEKVSNFSKNYYKLKILAFEYFPATIHYLKEGWKIQHPESYLWIDKSMGENLIKSKGNKIN